MWPQPGKSTRGEPPASQSSHSSICSTSEATTLLQYLAEPQLVPGLVEASVAPPAASWQQQPSSGSSRRHKPVKRQASAISGSELMPHVYDLAAQQHQEQQQRQQEATQWVQMWPTAGYTHLQQLQPQQQQQQQQLGAQLASPLLTSLVDPAAAAALPVPSARPGSMLQQQLQYGTAHAAVDAAAAAAAPVVLAPLGDALAAAHFMQAPPAALAAGTAAGSQHRLPKRRASAPHLMPNANSQPMFKCVPHTGGPDCQCTQCLCARTEELCRRLIAQRSAQAAGAAAPASQQQQGRPAGGSRSPAAHGKRRSFELPPVAGKNRRSPNKLSPSSSPRSSSNLLVQPPTQQQQQQQHAVGVPSPFAGPAMLGVQPGAASAVGPAAPAAAGGLAQLGSAGSGQLRGHFQGLTVSPPSVFDGSAGSAAAAAAAAAGLGRLPVAAGLDDAHEAGSGHSGVLGAEEDAELDRELEQLLAHVGWPLEAPAAGHQGSQQHPQQQQQQPHLAAGAAGCSGSASLAPGQAHQPKQQHSAAPAAGSACVAAVAGCSAAAQAELDALQDLGAELRLPSFDQWDPLLPGVCQGSAAAECSLLDDLLRVNNNDNPDAHSTEQDGTSLVDLLLN